jgi:5-methylcytosine-specific restriction protein A
MPKRPCLQCGRLTTNPSRCDQHAAEYAAKVEAKRGSASARGYGSEWRKKAARLVREHVAQHGTVCPGYGRQEPHESADLTVDHIVPRKHGGTSEPSNLRVLCRACNSAKRDRK